MSSRVKITIVASVVGFLAALHLAHRFSGQSQLDKYKTQLRARGELLSLADLPPPTCTNGNPNLDDLTNAVAQLKWRKFPSQEAFVMEFTEPGVAQVMWRREKLVSRKGVTNDWADLADALENNALAMETIRQSLKAPEADTGWSRTNFFDVPNTFIARRTAAQWLSHATLHYLRENELPLAQENLHALFQSIHVQRNDFPLVNQMIRIAFAGLAFSTTWETLQHPQWSEAQLEWLQTDLESVDLLDALEKGLLGEKILGLEYFQWLRSNRRLNRNVAGPATKPVAMGQSILGNVWSVTLAESDELSFLQAHQRNLEHMRLIRSGKTWPELAVILEDDMKQIENITESYRAFFKPITAIGIPNTRRAFLRAAQNETQRQMALAAVALKRYELRHGKPAADLAALVPKFLAKLPYDWMAQAPLKYKVMENGFLLYSVGEDGRDDGGNPNPSKPLGKKHFELWDGRDAVWPHKGVSP